MSTSPEAHISEFNLHETLLRFAAPSLHLLSLGVEGETWFDGGAQGHPLWQLLVVDEGGRRVTLDGSAAGTNCAEMYNGVLILHWTTVVDAETGAGPFDVRVEVRPVGHAAGITAWRIEVDNRAGAWTLWSVTFPQLHGLAPSVASEQDRLFYPQGWGTECVGWSKMMNLRHRCPRGWDFAMQMFGYTRGERTFSLATHDPRQTTKEFVFTRHEKAAARWADAAVILYPEGMTTPGNGYKEDFDIVVAVQPGDWYAAARLYAGWARHQPWACCPPASRAADAVQGWQVLMVQDKPYTQWAVEMEQLAQVVGVPLGIHFYNWHEIPFDTSYPDYFPAREGFREFAARLHDAGYLTMPYINGRLWDINAPSWPAKNASACAAKGSALRLRPLTLFNYMEEYGSGQKLSPMCPVTSFWQYTVLKLCTRIVSELGCDGVYIDQIAAEKAELCFDPAHGHALGGGGFWLDGYRQLIGRIRAAVPEAYITTECNWEGCVADYDGLLMWHSFGEQLIPLFPAVYSGLARTFGCQFNAADLDESGGLRFAARMAMLFAWGAQLGWGDLTLLLDEQRALLLEYFTTLCRERALHQEIFAAGRMLCPPSLNVAPQPDAVEMITEQYGPVQAYASLWATPAGNGAMVFLVNPTRITLQAEVRITADECAGMTVGTPQQGEFVLLSKTANPPAFTTTLPPLSVLAVPLK